VEAFNLLTFPEDENVIITGKSIKAFFICWVLLFVTSSIHPSFIKHHLETMFQLGETGSNSLIAVS
jgi:hypothetical protein